MADESPHFHQCEEWRTAGTCEEHTCRCRCGAVLAAGPTYDTDGNWAWLLPDGSFAKFPDPGLRSLPRAELLARHLVSATGSFK